MSFIAGISRWFKAKSYSVGSFMWESRPSESKKPVPGWFHFLLQIIAAGYLAYWHWNPPVPNKAVLGLAAVAALMVLADMRPIHKALYFIVIIALVFAENHAINEDRRHFAEDEAYRRQEEHRQFSNIGTTITDNVQTLLDNSKDQFAQTLTKSDRSFAATMRQFVEVQHLQKKTIAKVDQQAIEGMTPNELVQRARSIAKQMRKYEDNYLNQDKEIDLIYDSQINPAGGPPSVERVKDLQGEMDRARSGLANYYSSIVTPIIAQADQVRDSMVKRLREQTPEDASMAKWFEKPAVVIQKEGRVDPIIVQSYEKANYLDHLTTRFQHTVAMYMDTED